MLGIPPGEQEVSTEKQLFPEAFLNASRGVSYQRFCLCNQAKNTYSGQIFSLLVLQFCEVIV